MEYFEPDPGRPGAWPVRSGDFLLRWAEGSRNKIFGCNAIGGVQVDKKFPYDGEKNE